MALAAEPLQYVFVGHDPALAAPLFLSQFFRVTPACSFARLYTLTFLQWDREYHPCAPLNQCRNWNF